MKYMGGKVRAAQHIVPLLSSLRKTGQFYWEPFVGGCGIFEHMANPRLGSDANPDMVGLWNALLSGWVPPAVFTEADYANAQKLSVGDPLRGFAVGCSFGGKPWGGYARKAGARCFVSEARKTITATGIKNSGATFEHINFLDSDLNPVGWLIYCDPPYADTCEYKGTGKFDSVAFWQKCRELSKTNTVVISEEKAPEDFKCVLEFQKNRGLGHATKTEKLFIFKG